MDVYLLDGTYELFRHFYAVPQRRNAAGEEIGAVTGVVTSVVGMFEGGVTHLAVATDHVIESFRNDMYPGYKSSAGVDPLLLEQFEPLEDALRALGVTVWPMVEQEADDALAAGAQVAASDERVERVMICTPDKDLAQCVVGARVLQLDRRKREIRDEGGVYARFGVRPTSIPDYLALIGDSSDGYPGLAGWGARSAAAVLAKYESLEAIPPKSEDWEVNVRGAARLAETLRDGYEDAQLFKRLATLRRDAEVGTVDDWRYNGPTPAIEEWITRMEDDELAARIRALAPSP